MLRRSPGFTTVAILALALGIGGNTAIFSVVNAVLLRPLPYDQPDRIMNVFATAPDRGLARTSSSFYRSTVITDRSELFEKVGAYTFDTTNLTGIDEPRQLTSNRMSSGVLDELKVKPALGRNFVSDEDKPGGAQVVILSHSLWERQYGAAPDVVGRSITLDGISYTVVGIMGSTFGFPNQQVDVWLPRIFEPSFLNREAVERGAGYLNILGRLKPGVGRQQVQSEMESIISSSNRPDHPDVSFGVEVVAMPEVATQGVRPTLFILLGAVAFVLLIACANVANLLLAKPAG